MTISSTIDDVVALQPHRVAANLLFDGAGLSPYWATVGQYEPELEDGDETFAFDELEWAITNSQHWSGKIEAPDQAAFDGAMNEYKLGVYADSDEHDELGADFTFRPGFPEARHVETGDYIGGMPTQCPEAVRVQVEATNLKQWEILGLLQALASHLDINPSYFQDPHEWSSIYGLEVYGRLRREIATGQVAGKGGVLEHIAQFSNGRGRGEYKWDHEDIVGHYEAVSLDPENWQRLIPDQVLAKRLKCYQPEWVRSDEESDDPLYHHKIECQYWKGYYPDGDDSLRWDGYQQAVDELGQTIVNALNWAGVDFSPTAETWVADPYFDIEAADTSVEVYSNPMPDLEEQERASARDQLMDPETTAAEWDVLEAMTDGGSRRYDELAADAGRSTSTVYRAVEQFDDILQVDGGEVRFRDGIVRDQIEQVAEWFGSAKDAAVQSLRNVADRATPLSRGEDGEPSALERWVNRHGITVRESYDTLEFELSRPVSLQEMLKIVRAGLNAAESSSMLTSRFENAEVSWREPDGTHHKNERVVVNRRLLGVHNLDRPLA